MKKSIKAHSEGICRRGRASPSPPKYVDLDLQQPLRGPGVLVLFDMRRLSDHVVSA